MLRKVVFVGVASLFLVNAFAQQEKPNPYVESMQQTFDRASAAAAAEFSKNYPAPRVAQSPTEKNPPAVTAQTPPPPPSPPVAQPVAPAAPQPAKKIPDIAVNADKSGSSVGNIYAPGGNTQNSESNSSTSTINPYR